MSAVQKPFARWPNFKACEDEMMGLGHDKQSAGAICGSIETRAAKGMLYKRLGTLNVIKGRNGEMIVVGPATWELVDPERDFITIEAQKLFLRKFFHMAPRYRNISIDHESLIIGEGVLKAVGDDGRVYYSHVHEKGMQLVSKIRSDINLGWVRECRDLIARGIYKMYSIRGKAVKKTYVEMNGQWVRKILDLDPIETAIVKYGMCPMAGPLQVVSKMGRGQYAQNFTGETMPTNEELFLKYYPAQ